VKTNQNLVRKLNDFDVIQRTKDGMFNATSLLKQWNDLSGQQKDIGHFFENNATNELVEAIILEEDFNSRNSVYLKSAGRYGGTWMHPYLFIDFAMWLNPKFKLQVIKFVHDQLINLRHQSGDNYKQLCTSLSRFEGVDFSEVGKMLNYVVFKDHEKSKRNFATIEEQEELQQLERDLIKYIEMGFIKSYEEFKSVLRTEYSNKYLKKVS